MPTKKDSSIYTLILMPSEECMVITYAPCVYTSSPYVFLPPSPGLGESGRNWPPTFSAKKYHRTKLFLQYGRKKTGCHFYLTFI